MRPRVITHHSRSMCVASGHTWRLFLVPIALHQTFRRNGRHRAFPKSVHGTGKHDDQYLHFTATMMFCCALQSNPSTGVLFPGVEAAAISPEKCQSRGFVGGPVRRMLRAVASHFSR